MILNFRKSGRLFPALILASALALPLCASAQTRPFTHKDMALLERVSDPHVSPDGKLVVYDLRTTDWDANKGVHALWIAGTGDKAAGPRRLAASEGGATAPQWSPDGSAIYFMSSRSGSDQVWRTDAAGATAQQVTKLPLDVGAFRLTPDGRTLVVSMAVMPECSDLDCNVARADAKAKSKKSGVIYNRLFVRHWDTWADGNRNHLFAVPVDGSGEPEDLMIGFDGDSPSKPFGDANDFTITADGKAVIFSAKNAERTEAWTTNFDLWRVPLDDVSKLKNLTASNTGADEQPVVSPDGKSLAWRQQTRDGFEADRHAVMVMDLASGATKEADPGFDRSADKIAWTRDSKSLIAIMQDVGQTRLFVIDPKAGKARPITGPGHVSDFDVSRDAVVFVQDRLDSPAQIFKTDLKGVAASSLTAHNAQVLAGLSFGAYEQFSFPGWNGETVHGYVVKPAGYKEGGKYPVAFLIHGGPQGSFGNLFHYRWNAEAFSGAGYAVVMIDFHGSTGYGQDFTDAISQHWGDRPLEDLQKGWAYALGNYGFLDGGRACALGGSYGGFMINWIAGHWSEPWKCLVNHDGIFDNRSMGYATEELWFSEWENGGVPWKADYETFNPANAVDKWNKPELVIHSAKDYRVLLEQGLATFSALQRKGIQSQFLYYPDENHWVLKPQNNVQWHDTVFAWLERWTETEPPPK